MSIRTFGVEEELLLVDADSSHPVPAGVAVLGAAQDQLPEGRALQVEHEFKLEQAEIGSEPCTETAALRAQLVELRRSLAAAADTAGAQAVALGTSPLKVWPKATVDERYARMTDAFGLVARQQLTCGQHIHVQIASPDEGIGVIDRIRVWLPVITALSANSPFWQGEDTAYASYRSIAWGLWPTAGPTEPFGDPAGYQRALDALTASGVALDPGMIYFDARLSAKYPTVEIRVPDVSSDVDVSVLLAALVRALVDTAAGEWARGLPIPVMRVELLRGAAWRAARSGIGGDLVEPATALPRPAWSVVESLVDYVEPALRDHDDLPTVRHTLDRLRAEGTGADRQRAVHARRGELADVVQDAAARTVA